MGSYAYATLCAPNTPKVMEILVDDETLVELTEEEAKRRGFAAHNFKGGFYDLHGWLDGEVTITDDEIHIGLYEARGGDEVFDEVTKKFRDEEIPYSTFDGGEEWDPFETKWSPGMNEPGIRHCTSSGESVLSESNFNRIVKSVVDDSTDDDLTERGFQVYLRVFRYFSEDPNDWSIE